MGVPRLGNWAVTMASKVIAIESLYLLIEKP